MQGKSSNPHQALARFDMMTMSHTVRAMVECAVELRREAGKAPSRAERRRLDDEACDLLDEVYVVLKQDQPRGWLELTEAVSDIDALTAVRR